MLKVFHILPLIILLISCQRNPLKVDISDIDLTLNLKRLDQDIFKVTPENMHQIIPQLKQTYGPFLNAYNENIIAVGDPSDSERCKFSFPGIVIHQEN